MIRSRHLSALISSTLLLLTLGSGALRAEVWTAPGLYTVTVEGWSRNALPEGFGYRCVRCTDQIDIEIKYGPALSPTATWKTNDALMAELSTEAKQREFAQALLQGVSTPSLTVEIKRVGLSQIGGLRVLMIASRASAGRSVFMGTSMVAIHKNRLMNISVHFSEGAFTPESDKAITAFMSGLVFE